MVDLIRFGTFGGTFCISAILSSSIKPRNRQKGLDVHKSPVPDCQILWLYPCNVSEIYEYRTHVRAAFPDLGLCQDYAYL